MARTFSEILNNVCILINEDAPSAFTNTDSPYPEIKKYIQDTLEEICSVYPWSFRETSYSFDLVIGTSTYTLPVYLEPQNILKDGVRIEDDDDPLEFIEHQNLDKDISTTNGQPDRYSIFGGQIIFDAPPDDTYTITIKYLKSYYAFSTSGTAQANLADTSTDYTIIPDRWVKILEYGAAALYRQSFKPDNKYVTLQKQYERFLGQAMGEDGYGGDAETKFVTKSGQMSSYVRKMQSFYETGHG